MIGHDAKSVRSTTSSREPPTRHTYSAQCGYWSKHPPPICLSECLSETPSLVSGRRRQGYACRFKTRAVAGLMLDSVSDWPKTLALLRRLLRINHVVDPHRARVLWSACPQRGCPQNDQVVLWSTQLLRLGCGERHNLTVDFGFKETQATAAIGRETRSRHYSGPFSYPLSMEGYFRQTPIVKLLYTTLYYSLMHFISPPGVENIINNKQHDMYLFSRLGKGYDRCLI